MTKIVDHLDEKLENAASRSGALRVLVISHNFPHPENPGEAEFVVQEFQSLSEAGVKSHVIAPVPLAPRVPVWKARTRNALRKSRLKPHRWHIGGMSIDYPRYLKLPGHLDPGFYGPLFTHGITSLAEQLHQEEPFDLIHGQWLLPDGYAAAILGQRLGIPSVSSERGYAARCPPNGPLYRGTKRAIERLDQVITVSQALSESVNKIGNPRRKIEVIHTGVDLHRFEPSDRELARKSLNLPPGRYLLCCARAEPIKRPDVAIEAFCRVARSHSDLRFVWLGNGSELPVLSSAAESAGLTQRVHLPGNVPNAEVPQWLAASNLVLLASDSEGLPYSLVEAAASGRPVVATSVGGVPEIVKDQQTGLLVERRDITGLEQAIDRILRDPPLAEEMGRRARDHAVEHFSWNKYRSQTLAVYRDLLKR